MSRRQGPRERTPYNHPAWRAVQPTVMERDGRTCQIRSTICTHVAKCVDHIEPWRDGGAWFDLDNLRAACLECNSSLSSEQKHNRGFLRAPAHLVLVVGLADDKPLADHITFGDRDVLIDVDDIARAFTPSNGTPGRVTDQAAATAAAVVGLVAKQFRRGDMPDVGTETVWFLSTDADAREVFPYHDIIDISDRRDEVDHGDSSGVEPGRW